MLIDNNKITIINRRLFYIKNNRIQIIDFKDIYHSYIEIVKVGKGNHYHYLVMIEYLTYGDDDVFLQKKRFIVRDFRYEKTRADEFLII